MSAAGGSAAREVAVVSDDAGRAAVSFQLGQRAGVGNHRVVASAAGFLGEVEFSAAALAGQAARVLAIFGEDQHGAVGQPLPAPFVAYVVDAQGNPVVGAPVQFAVAQGGGRFAGQAATTVASDSDGRASATLTLGPDEGQAGNVVTAALPGGAVAKFAATGLRPGLPEDTTFSGDVLDTSNEPIPGATVSIAGSTAVTTTDASGHFVLTRVPIGHVQLDVDGSTSTIPEPYPKLEFMANTVAGRDNTLGHIIFLAEIDAPNSQVCGGDTACTLSMANVEGFSFTIAPHSATFRDGSKQGRVSVTQVHSDKFPLPAPNATSFAPVWTFQPYGTLFDPPVRVTVPNTQGIRPGEQVEIFQFDHDQVEFVSVGTATVSDDGSVITSDPGFGITKAGWGAPTPAPPPLTRLIGAVCTDSPAVLAELDKAKAELDQARDALRQAKADLDQEKLAEVEHEMKLALAKLATGQVVSLTLVAVFPPLAAAHEAFEVFEAFHFVHDLAETGKLFNERVTNDLEQAGRHLANALAHAAQAAALCPVGTAQPALNAAKRALDDLVNAHVTPLRALVQAAVASSANLLQRASQQAVHFGGGSSGGGGASTSMLANGEPGTTAFAQALENDADALLSNSTGVVLPAIDATAAALGSVVVLVDGVEIGGFQRCEVRAKGRTAPPGTDGQFGLDQVPADQGPVAAAVLCRDPSSPSGGNSPFSAPVASGVTNVGSVPIAAFPPSPSSLSLSLSTNSLSKLGVTARASVKATLEDDDVVDVSDHNAGTYYQVSNTGICSVDADGAITANKDGTCYVTALNQGVAATARVTIRLTDANGVNNDADHDGLPDDYERKVGLDPNDPSDAAKDPDGDGLTNLQEFQAGTEPFAPDTDGDGLRDGDELTRGTNPLVADTDKDGLLDGDEVTRGSNPLDADSDRDALSDGIEVKICGTPFCARPEGDDDRDGLSNLEEVTITKTDPTRADTDNDGLNDGGEILAGSNPFDPDTDKDGVSDGIEVEGGTNPTDPTSKPFDSEAPGAPEVVVGSVSILNVAAPQAPAVIEAVGVTVALLNVAEPTAPAATEAVGLPVSVLNVAEPAGAGGGSTALETEGLPVSVLNNGSQMFATNAPICGANSGAESMCQ